MSLGIISNSPRDNLPMPVSKGPLPHINIRKSPDRPKMAAPSAAGAPHSVDDTVATQTFRKPPAVLGQQETAQRSPGIGQSESLEHGAALLQSPRTPQNESPPPLPAKHPHPNGSVGLLGEPPERHATAVRGQVLPTEHTNAVAVGRTVEMVLVPDVRSVAVVEAVAVVVVGVMLTVTVVTDVDVVVVGVTRVVSVVLDVDVAVDAVVFSVSVDSSVDVLVSVAVTVVVGVGAKVVAGVTPQQAQADEYAAALSQLFA